MFRHGGGLIATAVTTAGLVVFACITGTAASATSATGAAAVQLLQPEDIAFDSAGNLFVSQFGGNQVDRIGAAGDVTVVAGTGVAGYSGSGGLAVDNELNAPTGLAFASDDLLIADHHNHCIRRVTPSGTIATIAGTCTKHG